MKKNQLVLSALAILIVIAGYVTISPSFKTKNENVSLEEKAQNTKLTLEKEVANAVSEQDVITENNQAKETLEAEKRPGEAILTSGQTVNTYLAKTKLEREKQRSQSKQTLLEIIDNTEVDEAQKKAAIDSMVTLTTNAQKEIDAENMLSAKGFNDSLVSISGGKVDVIICRNALSNTEKAQIEDIIKRKTEYGIEDIVISLMNVSDGANLNEE